jgi:hypothetical protein
VPLDGNGPVAEKVPCQGDKAGVLQVPSNEGFAGKRTIIGEIPGKEAEFPVEPGTESETKVLLLRGAAGRIAAAKRNGKISLMSLVARSK